MVVRLPPSDLTTDAKSLEMHHEDVDDALPGDDVGFNDGAVTNPKRGFVVSYSKYESAKEDSSSRTMTANSSIGTHRDLVRSSGRSDCWRSMEMLLCEDYCNQALKIALKVENFPEYSPLGRFSGRNMRYPVVVGVIKPVKKKYLI
ncbi:LOW QUALITY PROTEIN: hypothetical protein MARPO_0158s0021 [Marchantia polymorpha]|uniref:Uncharacterized protein n=1 Tax=Marchantia polymorpha TaxID=3197 RepID=A0A2R6W4B6_MARPO|nr:LOW QUALITY PROTEIN: hypothetical protein MARPO_0158s0021 [Marchantia polymorpha]|eukprot:PTQ28642.1 LOW QUALITY PROTEIN: hypothetical protein MARPO_0158s0021 [Marchantia polymorpha]